MPLAHFLVFLFLQDLAENIVIYEWSPINLMIRTASSNLKCWDNMFVKQTIFIGVLCTSLCCPTSTKFKCSRAFRSINQSAETLTGGFIVFLNGTQCMDCKAVTTDKSLSVLDKSSLILFFCPHSLSLFISFLQHLVFVVDKYNFQYPCFSEKC